MTKTLLLVIAILLGVAASVLHHRLLNDYRAELKPKTVSYAQLAKDYRRGEPIGDPQTDRAPDLFFKLDVPQDVKIPAVTIDKVGGFIGARAKRDLLNGELLLLQDLDLPQPELMLDEKQNEKLLMVSLRDVAIESGLLKVGSRIGFALNAADESAAATEGKSAPGKWRQLGPYKIVSIGTETQAGVGGKSEVLGVAVKILPNGSYDELGSQLLDAMSKRRIRAVSLYKD